MKAGMMVGALIAGGLGVAYILYGGGDPGRSRCVVPREGSGSVIGIYNKCGEPIRALICSTVLWQSGERCEVRDFQAGDLMTATGDGSGGLADWIGPHPVIHACKAGYGPERIGNGPVKCVKGSNGGVLAF